MPKKVLIGHPDKNFRYDLHKILAGEKFTVIEADNGGAMFTITKLQQPDIVVAADNMSSMGTEEYLKKLKELNLIDQISVVLLSAKNNILRNMLLMNMGLKEVVVEPIDELEILFHVKRLTKPFTPEGDEAELAINSPREQREPTTGGVRSPTSQSSIETRPISSARMVKANNSSLLIRHAFCQFCRSEKDVKLFTLKTRTILTEPDRFDIDQYVTSIGQHEYIDYSLLEVGVCSNCYFATHDFTMFDIQGVKAEDKMDFSEFVGQSFQKGIGERKAIIKKAGPSLFEEGRTPEEAIISYELAIHTLDFLFHYDKMKYSWAQNEMFQNHLKIGAIGEKYQLTESRNFHYKKAYDMGLEKMSLKGELGIRRHNIQMLALSYLMRDKENIFKFGKELFKFSQNQGANPQLRIKTREYVDRAKTFGWVEDENYWK